MTKEVSEIKITNCSTLELELMYHTITFVSGIQTLNAGKGHDHQSETFQKLVDYTKNVSDHFLLDDPEKNARLGTYIMSLLHQREEMSKVLTKMEQDFSGETDEYEPEQN